MFVRRSLIRLAAIMLTTIAAVSPLAAQQAPAARPGDTLGWHTVRPGDTLEGITQLYLGTPVLWRENWRLNPQVRDPNHLRIGQRLRVIVHRKLPKRMAEVETVSHRVDEKPHPNPWTVAHPGDLLKQRDGLRTHRQSSAKLRFGDGLQMVVTEDSLIFLNQLEEDLLGHSRDGIEIVRGTADLKVEPAKRRAGEIQVVVGSATARPKPGPSGVASRFASDGGAARVMVYTGASSVASAGDEVDVPQGMGTTVPEGAPPAPPEKLLPAPVLAAPSPGWKAPWSNPVLRWKPVRGASSYMAEVFADAGATKLVARHRGIEGTSWAPEQLPVGPLFWRVTAVAPSGLDGYPSKLRRLHVMEARPDLEPPVVAVLPVAGARAGGEGLQAVPGGVVRLIAHDDLAGVASMGYRWDEAAWRDAGRGMLRVPEAPGRHRLQVRATDRRGRKSRVWNVTVDVSGEGPRPPLIRRGPAPAGPADGAGTSSAGSR